MVAAISSRQLAVAAAALVLVPAVVLADHPAGVLGPSAGGPVLTPTADTLPAGAWSLGLYSEYRRFDALSDEALEAQAAAEGHVHALRYLRSDSLAASYGLTERLTLTTRLPYVKRDDIRAGHVHGDGSTGAHAVGDSAGLGDLSLSGYWRFWENDRGSAAALSFGSFLPTGATDERDQGGERLATEHQPGSGAWRPFLGVVVSREMGRLGWHSSLRYTWATEGAQDTEFGDRVDYGLAVSYRLTASPEEPAHHEHERGAAAHHHDKEARSALQWDLLLELNGEYQRPQRIGGTLEGDSEHTVFLAPGLRVSGNGGWTAALSVGVPVYQDPGRGHIETDWRAVATAGYAF